jgi:hypothetical protein
MLRYGAGGSRGLGYLAAHRDLARSHHGSMDVCDAFRKAGVRSACTAQASKSQTLCPLRQACMLGFSCMVQRSRDLLTPAHV